jgi:hypothetical protein
MKIGKKIITVAPNFPCESKADMISERDKPNPPEYNPTIIEGSNSPGLRLYDRPLLFSNSFIARTKK